MTTVHVSTTMLSGACRLVVGSIPPLLIRSAQQSRSLSSLTGCVKFFQRRTGFGFIIRDDGQGDIFVHATKIKKDFPDKYIPGHPFLRTNEKVRFIAKPSNKNLLEAHDVTFINGKLIPTFRKNYRMSVEIRARKQLGIACYEILSNDSLSADEKQNAIDDAYQKARSELDTAKQHIISVGLKFEDFVSFDDQISDAQEE